MSSGRRHEASSIGSLEPIVMLDCDRFLRSEYSRRSAIGVIEPLDDRRVWSCLRIAMDTDKSGMRRRGRPIRGSPTQLLQGTRYPSNRRHACQRPSGGDSRSGHRYFLVDLFALAGDASPSIAHMFTFNKPTGVLSGVTTTAKFRPMQCPYMIHLDRLRSDLPRPHIQFVKTPPSVNRY